MSRKILIISSDLEIGGIERSLIGLLNALDYKKFKVDLMLYSHQGDFMKYLPKGPRLLPQIKEYSVFKTPIIQLIKEGKIRITLIRLFTKFKSEIEGWLKNIAESYYLRYQREWRYAISYLPKIPGQYDVVISFLGPHYTAIDRVQANIKIGWIHTDYRMIPNDGSKEASMWGKLDYIAAVSKECRKSFLDCFPQFTNKTIVIENILSAKFIYEQAQEFGVADEMPSHIGLTNLLSVGRFCHAKGIDQAVLACRVLVDQGYNVKWYAIGYGTDELIIKRLIEENRLKDRFIILGKKANPYPYIRACDIFAQPSRYEGKAVTVREAQILGKPVLITRFPTADSQIEEGIDGHICELGVDGIVDGVRRLIDDKEYRERIATEAANRDYSNQDEVTKIYSLIPQT